MLTSADANSLLCDRRRKPEPDKHRYRPCEFQLSDYATQDLAAAVD
jgi:hypothetical protein